jgi:hypothetical protein
LTPAIAASRWPLVVVEEDFLQRQIRQITQALARVVGVKLEAGAIDRAREAIDRAYEDMFGLPRELLDRVDEASLALTLGNADKLAAYAWLLERHAEVLAQAGEPAEAARLRARASRIVAAG